MTSAIDSMLKLFGSSQAAGSSAVSLIVAVVIAGLVVFTIMAVMAIVAVYFERKVSAFMQDRIGPMEVGIFGFKGGKQFWGGIGQTLADTIKLLVKEDILPKEADKKLMIMAPFIIFIASFLTFIGVPLSENLVVSDFNIGIFYVIAAGSIGVIGIILAGWSSNNKWSLYGALRSAAQIISYEIPIGLSLMLVVIVVGSLNFGDIVAWQADHRWFFIHSPFAFLAFIIYVIAGVAETNRTPFDIPEAESELVAGWMTEYSGFRWSIFFMSEYANVLIISIIASVVFLGGWLSPLAIFGVHLSWLEGPLWGLFWIFSKAVFFVFVMMWFRWTFPRLRVDQLMYFCWKVLIPFALANLIFISVWELIF